MTKHVASGDVGGEHVCDFCGTNNVHGVAIVIGVTRGEVHDLDLAFTDFDLEATEYVRCDLEARGFVRALKVEAGVVTVNHYGSSFLLWFLRHGTVLP